MFHCLPDSARADGNLAEAAGQLGKMVVHRNQSQPNPGISSLGTTCRSSLSGQGGRARIFLNVSMLYGYSRSNPSCFEIAIRFEHFCLPAIVQ